MKECSRLGACLDFDGGSLTGRFVDVTCEPGNGWGLGICFRGRIGSESVVKVLGRAAEGYVEWCNE